MTDHERKMNILADISKITRKDEISANDVEQVKKLLIEMGRIDGFKFEPEKADRLFN